MVDQVGHKRSRPYERGGSRLPAGALVAPSILGVGRSEAFAEPEAFRPERFADG